MRYLSVFCLLLSFSMYSCLSVSKEDYGNILTTHAISNPKTLNPQCHTSQLSDQIVNLAFQSLVHLDLYSGKMVPLLAESLPEFEQTKEGKLKYTFKIRQQASWDDGKPITAKDVEFSLNVMFNPHCNNALRRQYLSKIESIEIDSTDNKKFTLVYAEPYIQACWALVDLKIIDHRIFDPKQLMKNCSLKKLKEYAKDFDPDKEDSLQLFGKQFNSAKYQTNTQYLRGSGAYVIDQWEHNQYIKLKRKKQWWANNIEVNHNHYFNANSEIIHFEIIKDWNLTLSALENGKLDVISFVPMDQFVSFQNDQEIIKTYAFKSVTNYIYEYLAFNTLDSYFSDVNLRKAIASKIDRDLLVDKVLLGFGSPTYSMIHPTKSYYNKEIVQIDTSQYSNIRLDPDSIIKILINSGNKRKEKVANFLVNAIKSLGGKAKVESWDWKVFLDKRKKRDFDIVINTSGGSPVPEMLAQSWHTSSIESGRNFSGFGNHQSDALIDSINMEMNEVQRNRMYKRFQWLVDKQQPYVFLYTLNQRIMLKKKFDAVKISSIRPNYWLGDF